MDIAKELYESIAGGEQVEAVGRGELAEKLRDALGAVRDVALHPPCNAADVASLQRVANVAEHLRTDLDHMLMDVEQLLHDTTLSKDINAHQTVSKTQTLLGSVSDTEAKQPAQSILIEKIDLSPKQAISVDSAAEESKISELITAVEKQTDQSKTVTTATTSKSNQEGLIIIQPEVFEQSSVLKVTDVPTKEIVTVSTDDLDKAQVSENVCSKTDKSLVDQTRKITNEAPKDISETRIGTEVSEVIPTKNLKSFSETAKEEVLVTAAVEQIVAEIIQPTGFNGVSELAFGIVSEEPAATSTSDVLPIETIIESISQVVSDTAPSEENVYSAHGVMKDVELVVGEEVRPIIDENQVVTAKRVAVPGKFCFC